MEITKDIRYAGVNDHEIDLFEGQYKVENGMAYNSYVIMDEKIAVMDTVDASFYEEWMQNIKQILGSRTPDYLVVQHMEPDHSANISAFLETFPDTVIVSSAPAFNIMKQFFGTDYADRRQIVKEGDTLSLGVHTLQFIGAPMVHWPEVIVTYDQQDKVLFSADGFGKFGALDVEEDWACEASRYYFGIVGKFGMQVQNLLKKAAALDIQAICPLHGPVLKENLGYYVNLYQTWSSYGVESDGIMIAYTSVYGHTKEAAIKLQEILKNKGEKNVITTDLCRDDMHEAVKDAFCYDRLVLAAASYDGGMFPAMADFLYRLKSKNCQKRRVALIENGSWAPCAGNAMKAYVEEMKNMTLVSPIITIKSAMKSETITELEHLADALM